MAVAGGGGGNTECLGTNQPAQGHKSGKRGGAVVGFAGGEGERLGGNRHAGVSRRGATRQVVVARCAAGEGQAGNGDAVVANILAAKRRQRATGVDVGAVCADHTAKHRALHAAGIGGAVVHLVRNVQRGD